MRKLFNLWQRLFFHIPTALPRGTTEFEAWYTHIIKVYGLDDNLSYKNAIATMVMHLGPTCDRISRAYFVRSIHKAMSNEIAWNVIQDIKKEQKAKEEAATLAANPQPCAEATHTSDPCEKALEQTPTA